MTQWIITSSILITVVAAMRFLLRGKISLRLQYALWALVLLRLLVPVSFGATGLSVMNAVPDDVGAAILSPVMSAGIPDGAFSEPADAPVPAIGADNAVPDGVTVQVNEGSVTGEFHRVTDWGAVARIVWLSGSALMALWLIASNLRFSARLRRSRRALNIDGCALPVYVSEMIDTPCLFGLFHPTIYVTPAVAENETVLRHSVEHETTHFRHGDHIWAILRGLCLALHWFNPLVWLAAALSRRDAELACDEATIRHLGEGERTQYGRTLIGLTCRKRTALLLTATTMTGSKRGIKERITLIAKKPKMAIYTLVAVVLIAAVAVGCTFTGAKENPYTWTSRLSVDDITATNLWGYAGERELSEQELRELVPLINALKNRDFTENKDLTGGTPVYGLTLELDGATYHFNECNAADLELVGYGDKQWWIDSAELSDFINRAITKNDEQTLSVKYEADSSIPQAVIDYATNYTQTQLDYYTDDIGYEITEAKITGITQIGTGTAGLVSGVNMYLLEYRFLAANPDEVMLVGGMRMDGDYITEWGSTGQPYLLLHWDDSGDETAWQRVCVTNSLTMQEEYGTPDMLDQYGDMYTAAAMELYNEWSAAQSELSTWDDADMERWQNEAPLIGFSVRPAGSYEEIGQQWAEAFVRQYIDNTSPDSPLYSTDAAVLSCTLWAESLLTAPKTLIFNMRFVCDAADTKGFERWYVGWAGPLDDADYPQYKGWVEFGWFIVLEQAADDSWYCQEAGTGGYGGWGYLNYDSDGEFEALMEYVLDGSGSDWAANVIRCLPLMDWRDFGATYDAEGWSALYTLLDAHCLTDGQVYGPEETRMWSDVYPDDQAYRNLYVIRTALNSDGVYAEGLAEILKKQRDFDPELFDSCLQSLTQSQRETIATLIAAR